MKQAFKAIIFTVAVAACVLGFLCWRYPDDAADKMDALANRVGLAPNYDSESAAIARISRIPLADPELQYTLDNSDSTIPLVQLNQKGAFIRGVPGLVPFDHVLSALATLPRGAWGHGRIIIFLPCPIGRSNDPFPSESDSKNVRGALVKAGIKFTGVRSG